MRVGVDTGGTFTDLVAADGTVRKVPSTPADPAAAVAAAVAGLGPDVVAHGTTVATNALLEGRLAPVALVTNEGFADLVEIARQDRPSLYDPFADRPAPLVARRWRYEVRGRLGPDGTEVTPLDLSTLAPVDPAVAAVAVCLLHADLNPAHERAVRDELVRRGLDAVCSHEVSPEYREYERTVTTLVDAALRPVCRAYLRALAGLAPAVWVMTSAGGLLPAAEAAEHPAALLLSGPAAGAHAAAAVAAACGFPTAVAFDMGGTSTDVCLLQGGVPAPAPSLVVGGYPVRLPALGIHTIGAGGGSIAALDRGGALTVGPRSAGAVPGPACYGRGGEAPTVTDADLVLGRIPHGAAFSGLGPLDVAAARAALARAGVDAAGLVDVVNATMVQALRQVTLARGVDPTGAALVAFGGAGPLHACDLAGELGMDAVVVPARAGVLSAAGLLGAPVRRDVVRSWPTPGDHEGLGRALAALADQARRLVAAPPGRPVQVATAVDCRYPGQSHELTVASVEDFHAEHARRNGFSRPGAAVEVVALRAGATVASPVGLASLGAADRAPVVGPAVVAEPDCTIWVPPGWRGEPGPGGALVLRRTP